MTMPIPPPVGRAAGVSPGNRFERVHRVDDFEQLDQSEGLPIVGRIPTEFMPDRSRSVISHNDSPDIGFRYSLNPYRGCEHGCSYCYAQPKSAQPEDRAVLLILACKWRSNCRYRPLASVQEWPVGVQHGWS